LAQKSSGGSFKAEARLKRKSARPRTERSIFSVEKAALLTQTSLQNAQSRSGHFLRSVERAQVLCPSATRLLQVNLHRQTNLTKHSPDMTPLMMATLPGGSS
jgi:hypothetical protein